MGLVLTTGLTPLLVLGHITAVPYIFFLGVLPARTLRRAIHAGRPNRCRPPATAQDAVVGGRHLGQPRPPPLPGHLGALAAGGRPGRPAPPRDTRPRHTLRPLRGDGPVVVTVVQAVVVAAHCLLRARLPEESTWDFPSLPESRHQVGRGQRCV